MKNEAAYLKALSNEIRLGLIILLANNGETCVCQLAGALDEPEYKISRHLAVLRMQGIVESRPQGAWMYYQLTPSNTVLSQCLVRCFREEMKNHPDTKKHLNRLKTISCKK